VRGKQKFVYVGCRANVNRSFILEQILLNLIKEASLPIAIKSASEETSTKIWYFPTIFYRSIRIHKFRNVTIPS